jgi:ATP-dependent Lhr-like helicase
MRFLLDWQRVSPGAQGSGPDALAAVLAQLEGFRPPVVAWESRILPARVADYEISWLDELCRAGRLVWMRVPGRAPAALPSAAPARSAARPS